MVPSIRKSIDMKLSVLALMCCAAFVYAGDRGMDDGYWEKEVVSDFIQKLFGSQKREFGRPNDRKREREQEDMERSVYELMRELEILLGIGRDDSYWFDQDWDRYGPRRERQERYAWRDQNRNEYGRRDDYDWDSDRERDSYSYGKNTERREKYRSNEYRQSYRDGRSERRSPWWRDLYYSPAPDRYDFQYGPQRKEYYGPEPRWGDYGRRGEYGWNSDMWGKPRRRGYGYDRDQGSRDKYSYQDNYKEKESEYKQREYWNTPSYRRSEQNRGRGGYDGKGGNRQKRWISDQDNGWTQYDPASYFRRMIQSMGRDRYSERNSWNDQEGYRYGMDGQMYRDGGRWSDSSRDWRWQRSFSPRFSYRDGYQNDGMSQSWLGRDRYWPRSDWYSDRYGSKYGWTPYQPKSYFKKMIGMSDDGFYDNKMRWGGKMPYWEGDRSYYPMDRYSDGYYGDYWNQGNSGMRYSSASFYRRMMEMFYQYGMRGDGRMSYWQRSFYRRMMEMFKQYNSEGSMSSMGRRKRDLSSDDSSWNRYGWTPYNPKSLFNRIIGMSDDYSNQGRRTWGEENQFRSGYWNSERDYMQGGRWMPYGPMGYYNRMRRNSGGYYDKYRRNWWGGYARYYPGYWDSDRYGDQYNRFSWGGQKRNWNSGYYGMQNKGWTSYNPTSYFKRMVGFYGRDREYDETFWGDNYWQRPHEYRRNPWNSQFRYRPGYWDYEGDNMMRGWMNYDQRSFDRMMMEMFGGYRDENWQNWWRDQRGYGQYWNSDQYSSQYGWMRYLIMCYYRRMMQMNGMYRDDEWFKWSQGENKYFPRYWYPGRYQMRGDGWNRYWPRSFNRYWDSDGYSNRYGYSWERQNRNWDDYGMQRYGWTKYEPMSYFKKMIGMSGQERQSQWNRYDQYWRRPSGYYPRSSYFGGHHDEYDRDSWFQGGYYPRYSGDFEGNFPWSGRYYPKYWYSDKPQWNSYNRNWNRNQQSWHGDGQQWGDHSRVRRDIGRHDEYDYQGSDPWFEQDSDYSRQNWGYGREENKRKGMNNYQSLNFIRKIMQMSGRRPDYGNQPQWGDRPRQRNSYDQQEMRERGRYYGSRSREFEQGNERSQNSGRYQRYRNERQYGMDWEPEWRSQGGRDEMQRNRRNPWDEQDRNEREDWDSDNNHDKNQGWLSYWSSRVYQNLMQMFGRYQDKERNEWDNDRESWRNDDEDWRDDDFSERRWDRDEENGWEWDDRDSEQYRSGDERRSRDYYPQMRRSDYWRRGYYRDPEYGPPNNPRYQRFSMEDPRSRQSGMNVQLGPLYISPHFGNQGGRSRSYDPQNEYDDMMTLFTNYENPASYGRMQRPMEYIMDILRQTEQSRIRVPMNKAQGTNQMLIRMFRRMLTGQGLPGMRGREFGMGKPGSGSKNNEMDEELQETVRNLLIRLLRILRTQTEKGGSWRYGGCTSQCIESGKCTKPTKENIEHLMSISPTACQRCFNESCENESMGPVCFAKSYDQCKDFCSEVADDIKMEIEKCTECHDECEDSTPSPVTTNPPMEEYGSMDPMRNNDE